MSSGNPLEILRELKTVDWPTKSGGLLYAVGVFLLSSAVIIVLDKAGIPLSVEVKVAALIALQLLHFIVWLIKRYYFNDPNILTIAFGITTDETSRGLYKEIKKRFQQQIAVHGLRNNLRIKELPADISFPDSNSAEKFILEKGIRLLVWGNTEEGNIRNAPFSLFKINLSYLHGTLDVRKEKQFTDDLDLAVQRRKWGISHPESFHQLDVVSENVLEISLFTLGACLATISKVSYLLISVEIFEKLQNMLKNRKPDVNFPNLQQVREKTRSLLRDLYSILMLYYWHARNNLEKSIEYAHKVLKIDENNFNAHQNMAVFQWLKGNKSRAYFHTDRAWRIIPGDSLPRLNRAFFHICGRNFERALKEYKRIESIGNTSIVDVVEFLEEEYEKAKDNLGFLFGAGWLNLKFADQLRGRELLLEFVAKSSGDSSYSVLIEEAKRVLNTKSESWRPS